MKNLIAAVVMSAFALGASAQASAPMAAPSTMAAPAPMAKPDSSMKSDMAKPMAKKSMKHRHHAHKAKTMKMEKPAA